MGEYVVLDELPEEELLVVDQVGETDEMPPMLFRDNRVVVRRSKKDRRKLVKLLRCCTCRTRTTHLKKHVLRHHVCRRWWVLYPTKVCWSCKRHEIALHAHHHGTFCQSHVPLFLQKVDQFVTWLFRELRIRSATQLFTLIRRRKLGKAGSISDEAERLALDQYHHYQGLWPLRKRNPAAPTRLTTVLHRKTLQGLLSLCKSRTRSQSHRIAPPQDKGKVVISQSMKPRDSSSRASMSLQCIDSHCHLDWLFGKLRFWGSLVQFLEQYGETDHL